MGADVRSGRDDLSMWQVTVVCSDDRCAELIEVVVADLDEVEAVVCECECNVVMLGVASFEPVTAAA
jgi:hypothetical protein